MTKALKYRVGDLVRIDPDYKSWDFLKEPNEEAGARAIIVKVSMSQNGYESYALGIEGHSWRAWYWHGVLTLIAHAQGAMLIQVMNRDYTDFGDPVPTTQKGAKCKPNVNE